MKIVSKILKIILNIFMIAILFVNSILILKSIIFPKDVPSIFGYKPFIVIDGSNQTGVEKGDFVISKETYDINKGDNVVVKSQDRNATTYSVSEKNGTMLVLEDESSTKVNLYVDSIEGKIVYTSALWGEIFLLLTNPIVIFVVLILTIIFGVIIYRFLKIKNEE